MIVSFFFLPFLVAAKKAALSLNQFISFKGKDNKTVISGHSTKGAADTLILKLIKSKAVSLFLISKLLPSLAKTLLFWIERGGGENLK